MPLILLYIQYSFNAQHVSAVNTTIFRSLRLVGCYFMGCIWFGVCWRSVSVWLWRCGVFMQSEARFRLRLKILKQGFYEVRLETRQWGRRYGISRVIYNLESTKSVRIIWVSRIGREIYFNFIAQKLRNFVGLHLPLFLCAHKTWC